jgi:hypothetical protein
MRFGFRAVRTLLSAGPERPSAPRPSTNGVSRTLTFRDFLAARLESARRASDSREDQIARAEARLCAELLAAQSTGRVDTPAAELALETTRAVQSDCEARQAATNLLAGWRIVAGPHPERQPASAMPLSA